MQPYRRNQILKKATENYQITPVECAAIHPQRKYLEELFEQLDDLGQGHTDGLSRTVAHFAAASETSDCLEYLISKGFNCMQLDKNKISPLLLASKYGRAHNVKLLLNTMRGNSTEESTSVADTTMLPQRWTALHFASFYGATEVCRVLLQEGARIDAQDSATKGTPLHFAAAQGHIECIKVLLDEGKADVDISDKFGSTPLHLACKNGQYEAVVVLLSYGANVDGGDTSDNTALHYATAYGWINIVQLLLETTSCNMSPTNLWKTTPCGIADRKGHTRMVRFLLDNKTKRIDVNFKDDEGKTLLHNSCTIHHPDLVEFFLKHGADANLQSADPNNHNAFGIPIIRAVKSKCLEAIKHLIGAGANINVTDVYGNSVLHYAVRSEKVHIVKLVIDSGANVNARNQWNQTPFHWAIQSSKEQINTSLRVEKLECDQRDIFGRSPLHYAARVGSFTCTTRLLERGPDLNAVDKEMNSPINLSMIYDHVDYSVMMSQKGAMLRGKIHLPDGKSMSTFEYSLSKSFLNLGYFMMEKDISPHSKYNPSPCMFIDPSLTHYVN
ncbi:ankyrin repeat-containing domain protein [Umbelopsis sp. AD052]|nr:ankyrin repeat-containing domain protein [Umbelopsis sp. AD052]